MSNIIETISTTTRVDVSYSHDEGFTDDVENTPPSVEIRSVKIGGFELISHIPEKDLKIIEQEILEGKGR